MNTNHEDSVNPEEGVNHEEGGDELPVAATTAIAQIRDRRVPEDSQQRSLTRATALETGESVSKPGVERRHTGSRRRLVARVCGWSLAATVVIALLVVGRSALEPQLAWSDVVATMEKKPWVRLTRGDSEAGPAGEVWFAPSRGITASVYSHAITHVNVSTGERFEFDTKTGTLARMPLRDSESADSLATIGHLITHGEVTTGDGLFGFKIVQQQSRTVEEGGRKWQEFKLVLKRNYLTSVMVVRVDPLEKAPVWWESRGGEEGPFRTNIDYPAEGPEDIYAMGVSRDLEVIDCIPTGDLKLAMAKLAEGFHGFGDYTAIISWERGVPFRVIHRQGDKWRVDRCVATDRVEELTGTTEQLVADTNSNAWWEDSLKKFELEPLLVCDGEQECRYESNTLRRPARGITSRGYTQHQLVELSVYPPFGLSPEFETRLRPAGVGEPEGTVLLHLQLIVPRATAPVMFDEAKFWLDPSKGYAVVKKEFHGLMDFDLPHDPYRHLDLTNQVLEFDEFRKSPRGHHYPTVMVWKNAIEKDVDPDNAEPRDITTYFHLDFDAEEPDSFFELPPIPEPTPQTQPLIQYQQQRPRWRDSDQPASR